MLLRPLLFVIKRACQKMGMPASHLEAKCWRMFPEVGHFENISPVGLAPHDLSREDGAGQATGWRYTPYLTSTLGVTGPEDAIALPERKLGATEGEWRSCFPMSRWSSSLSPRADRPVFPFSSYLVRTHPWIL